PGERGLFSQGTPTRANPGASGGVDRAALPFRRGGFPSSNRLPVVLRGGPPGVWSDHGPTPGRWPLELPGHEVRRRLGRNATAVAREKAEGGNAGTRIRGGATAPRPGPGPAAGAA